MCSGGTDVGSGAAPVGSRVVGVDLGKRRIGLAVSDPTGTIASPLRVLERTGDVAADHDAIVAVAREVGASVVVVGFPRSLSGREGPAARAVRAEVEALREVAGPAVQVVLHDERFTTRLAERRVAQTPSRRRGAVDDAAAAVILESYLEASR